MFWGYPASICLMLCAVLLSSVSSGAFADELDYLEGTWTAVTKGKSLAEPVTFQRSFVGYDVLLPFFEGPSSVTKSSGDYGSHLKVTSRDNEVCFYYVNKISANEFTLASRGPADERCPESAVFKKVRINIEPTQPREFQSALFFGPDLSKPAAAFQDYVEGVWMQNATTKYFSVTGYIFEKYAEARFNFKREDGKFQGVRFHLSDGDLGDGAGRKNGYQAAIALCKDFPIRIANEKRAFLGTVRKETIARHNPSESNLIKRYCSASSWSCEVKAERAIFKFSDRKEAFMVATLQNVFVTDSEAKLQTAFTQCSLTYGFDF